MNSSHEQIEYIVDTQGISYDMARRIMGDSEEQLQPQEKAPRLPGKPLSFPPRGNVRDFHDGGRADEYRGGVQATESLSLEQIERNHRGAALAREAVRAAREQSAASSTDTTQ